MKYIKFIIPRYGVFTNGFYDVKGWLWLGRLCGVVIKSQYPLVYPLKTYVDLPEYHLPNDEKPQFIRK